MHKRIQPSHKSFKYYAGRGIAVCERWSLFVNFLADMGERPAGTQLDRIDNEGHYEPGNCRWITPRENCINRRSTVFLEHDGKRMSVSDWAREIGCGILTLHARLIDGWSTERALTQPIKKQKNNRADNRL